MQAGVTNRLDVDRKMLDCARDRPRSSTLPLPLLLLLGLPIPHPHCDADATVVADIIDVCGCMASGCLWPHQVPRGQKGCTVPCHPHYAHRSLHGSPPLAVADLFNPARVVDAMADGVVLGDGGAAGGAPAGDVTARCHTTSTGRPPSFVRPTLGMPVMKPRVSDLRAGRGSCG